MQLRYNSFLLLLFGFLLPNSQIFAQAASSELNWLKEIVNKP
jgi:hypothetical protein